MTILSRLCFSEPNVAHEVANNNSPLQGINSNIPTNTLDPRVSQTAPKPISAPRHSLFSYLPLIGPRLLLNDQLQEWVNQGGQEEKGVRTEFVRKLKKAGAKLKNGNIVVKKNLDLYGCTGLTSLPVNLHVGGNLYLNSFTGLTSLPANLHVGGNLNLSYCRVLTSLPENLHVGGNLNLRVCRGLTSLPVNLHVGGNLDLSHCTGLTSLPENLHVGGSLNLRGCAGLTSSPENLHVGGCLNLRGCAGLTSLPENLHVGGNLDLEGCTGLNSSPENLHVGGFLNLFGCRGLTSLPANLHVGGNLDLSHCTGLTSLPENLHVGGSLNLRGCAGLTSLPENLHVGGNLDLRGCAGLTSLPENLHVGGNLNLRVCRGLTSLPVNLHVGGNLDLFGCRGLTSLPENVSCRSLNLAMSNLVQVPANLDKIKNARTINLYGNQIAALPDSLGQLPEGTEIVVENNPIPPAELQRFRAAYPHIILRAGDINRNNAGAINVHERKMVKHFESVYRTLEKRISDNTISVPSIDDTKRDLLAAAKKYKMTSAEGAIKYMLGNSQRNSSVMDFHSDVTSGKVLTRAWALIKSQKTQEDRDNGLENLIKHLSNAKGYCNTRHAEETLLALQDSYSVTLDKTAAQQSKLAASGSDGPKVTLTVGDAIGYFMNDMKAFLRQEIDRSPEISDDDLKARFQSGLYDNLAQKHSNIESLDTLVSQVIKYMSEDWSTFVDMAKEMTQGKLPATRIDR